MILCNAAMKRNGQSVITYTLLSLTQTFLGGKAKINVQTTLKLTVFINADHLVTSWYAS